MNGLGPLAMMLCVEMVVTSEAIMTVVGRNHSGGQST